jgi:hypothetical protein
MQIHLVSCKYKLNIVNYISRYRGYCPQIKYRVGKTYGTDTHELAQVSVAILCVCVSFANILLARLNHMSETYGVFAFMHWLPHWGYLCHDYLSANLVLRTMEGDDNFIQGNCFFKNFSW